MHSSLTGTLPNDFSKLTDCVYANFHDNFLTGTIPKNIGSLTKLYALHLHENFFTGAIPTQISNLTNLLVLKLGCYYDDTNCSIASTKNNFPSSFSKLSKLTQFHLLNSAYSSTFPESFSSWTNLNSFTLSDGFCKGKIPNWIVNFRKLEDFQIQNNKLSGKIPINFWKNLSNLRRLKLYDNMLSGPISEELIYLTGLTTALIFNNYFSSSIPNAVLNIPDHQIRQFIAENNSFTGTLPNHGNIPINFLLNNNKVT
jgi:hypothetical protein